MYSLVLTAAVSCNSLVFTCTWLLDCSDNGDNLTWQGAYSVTAGLADRNNYQYGCLDTAVNIPGTGRYGVSVDSAKIGYPIPVWGRVYAPSFFGFIPLSLEQFPCGEHITEVSKHIGAIN